MKKLKDDEKLFFNAKFKNRVISLLKDKLVIIIILQLSVPLLGHFLQSSIFSESVRREDPLRRTLYSSVKVHTLYCRL